MTQNFITIKSACAMSAEVLARLKKLDLDHFPTPWNDESWDKLFESAQNRIVVVAEVSGAIIGFALFDLSDADSFAHLLKIVVDPKLRGRGVGKNLLNESIKILKTRQIKSFFLEVEEHNSAAISLYEQAGFKIIHTKKQYYSSGATAFIMTLSV